MDDFPAITSEAVQLVAGGALLRAQNCGMTGEYLRVVHFRRARHVLDVALYAGEARNILVPLRAIISDALRLGSRGLLLSHNHPSGDPRPSEADVEATRRLVRVAAELDIAVHDHLIIGAHRHMSFRAAGLL